MIVGMKNNDPKKNVDNERKKETENLDKKFHGQTNAQLAAEAMDRLAKGEGSVHDIILLQRYMLKKPSQTHKT